MIKHTRVICKIALGTHAVLGADMWKPTQEVDIQ